MIINGNNSRVVGAGFDANYLQLNLREDFQPTNALMCVLKKIVVNPLTIVNEEVVITWE